MWGEDDSFLSLVLSVWQKLVSGSIMFQISHKLKLLQKVLSSIRRKYSDVIQIVDRLREELIDVQEMKTQFPHDRDIRLDE